MQALPRALQSVDFLFKCALLTLRNASAHNSGVILLALGVSMVFSMPVESDVFSELMLRVRQGDAGALQSVLDDFGEAIQREVRFTLLDTRLRRFVGDSDVYQSVILRFISGMRDGHFQIETPKDLVRLLKGIARTRIAELVRFWHAQRRDLSRTAVTEDALFGQVSEGEFSPIDVLEQAELAAAVQDRLTPRDCEILRLRDEGLSWSDIAIHLGAFSGEAIRKQHTRSLARIAAELNAAIPKDGASN